MTSSSTRYRKRRKSRKSSYLVRVGELLIVLFAAIKVIELLGRAYNPFLRRTNKVSIPSYSDQMYQYQHYEL